MEIIEKEVKEYKELKVSIVYYCVEEHFYEVINLSQRHMTKSLLDILRYLLSTSKINVDNTSTKTNLRDNEASPLPIVVDFSSANNNKDVQVVDSDLAGNNTSLTTDNKPFKRKYSKSNGNIKFLLKISVPLLPTPGHNEI